MTIGRDVIDLRSAPLWKVFALVKEATLQGLHDAWIHRWGAEANIHTRIFVEPVQDLMRRPLRKTWSAEHRTRVRVFFCGSSWTQSRLYKRGVADSPLCQACFEEEGTERHRAFRCSARREARQKIGGFPIAHRGANPWSGFEFFMVQGPYRGSPGDPSRLACASCV